MPEVRGYPLPEGDAYTSEHECMILFLPKKDRYRQALRGALDYMATWLAWERDDQKRGKDAARAWMEANELTWDCYDMNTCEQIISLLTEIRDKTGQCCGESTYVTYQENVVVTTVVVPGQGTVPATWGQQPLTTWDEWDEYVCGASHAYVDDLIDTVEKIGVAATVGGFVLDFVAHLFSLVQWRMVEDIIPVNFSVVTAIFDALGSGLLGVDFTAVMAQIEASRDDIVCALMCGTDLETAVNGAINNQALWDTFFQWIDYESTTAAIYNGEVEGIGYLPVIQATNCQNCDCSPPGTTWDYDFSSDLMGFVKENTWRTFTWSASGYAVFGYPSGGDWSTFQGAKSEDGDEAVTRFGTNPYPSKVNRFEMRFRHVSNGYGGLMYIRIVYYNPSTEQVVDGPYYASTSYPVDTWHTVQWEQSPQVFLRANNWFVMVRCRLGSSSLLPKHEVDYIKVIRDD